MNDLDTITIKDLKKLCPICLEPVKEKEWPIFIGQRKAHASCVGDVKRAIEDYKRQMDIMDE